METIHSNYREKNTKGISKGINVDELQKENKTLTKRLEDAEVTLKEYELDKEAHNLRLGYNNQLIETNDELFRDL